MHLLSHHDPAHWAVPVPLTIILLLIAALYLFGWRRVRFSDRSETSATQLFSFLAGLALLWLALASPLVSFVHQFLTAHMIQHLLLMTVAPALILLADPLKTLRCAIPTRFAQSLANLLWIPPLPQLGTSLVNPISGLLISTLVLIGWHIPAIFALSFESPSLHQLEQSTFIFAGFLFWWPVIQPWPASYAWSRWFLLLYLFVATLPCDILSAYLTFCDRIVYAPYRSLHPGSSTAVLQDQELAGSLMWTAITILYLVPAVLLTVQLLGHAHPADRVRNDSSRTI